MIRRPEIFGRLPVFDSNSRTIRVPLEICGIRLDFLTSSKSLAAAIDCFYSCYAGTGPAVIEIAISSVSEQWGREALDPDFESRGNETIQKNFAAKRLVFGQGVAEQVVAVVPEGDATLDGIHQLMLWILPKPLLARGAMIVQAAGLVKDGRGFAFFGYSGAGKSTLISMITESDNEAAIMGDELVIIQMANAGATPQMHTFPVAWDGSTVAPLKMSVPLAGLFQLQQATEHAISSLSYNDAVTGLGSCAIASRFEDSIEARVALAARFMFSSCGVMKLQFKKDAGFWKNVIQHTSQQTRSANRLSERALGLDQG